LNNSSFEYAYPAYCNPCFNFWAENGVALEADDIDGDGKTNLLAVTNLGSLSVYNFDDPNGPFTVFYPILSGVASTLVLADIDGDGLKDVASAGKVYRNTSTPGSISFAEPSATGFSISWTSLAYADFNRDGKLDLVAADDTNNMVEFYENNSSVGNISFTNGFQRAITNPTSVASSDINSDGFPEVIVASRSTNRIGVLGNKAVTGPILTGSMDPTFTLLVTGAGSLPTKIAVGDLASDGFPEIVAILSGTSNYMVFRNTASTSPVTTASFQGGVPYAFYIPTVATSVRLADLDSDGKVDMLFGNSVTNAGGPTIVKNFWSGSPLSLNEFISVSSYVQSTFPVDRPKSSDVLPLDYDNDGRMDYMLIQSGASGGFFRNVIQANQNITFPALSPVDFGSAPFNLPAFSTSGLPITYTSSNSSVATVDGGVVTIVGAGNVLIKAFQSGNAIYAPALNDGITQSLTVKKGTPTVTFPAIPQRTIGDLPLALVASSNAGPVGFSSSDPSIATILSNNLNVNNAGTVTISALFSGDANWNSASSPQTITINKANQVITFNPLAAKNFGDAPFTLIATNSSPLVVALSSSNLSVATISGTTVTIVGAGSTIITASQVGNPNYNAAASVTQTLTVNKANQTITFNPLPPKNLLDVPFPLTASSNSPVAITYTSSNTSVATIVGNIVTLVGAGSTDITASQPGNANYNTATSITQILTINKVNQSITFGALSTKTFGDADFILSGSASSSLPITYSSSMQSVATVSGNTVTIVGAGTTTISASQSGNANFNTATNVTQTLNVSKANQTITFAALSAKTYGDGPFTLTSSTTSGLPIIYTSSNGSVASISNIQVTIIGAGSTTITASQTGNANYNAATSVTQTLNVSKASQSITFNSLPVKNFGDADFALNATANSTLAITYTSSNTSVATVSGNTVTIVGVGTTNITASQAGNSSYNAAANIIQPLTVAKANQTITFNPLLSVSQSSAPFQLTATASSGLTVSYTSSNALVATVSGNTITIVGVGTTTITALQAGNANYHAAVSVAQTLEVNAKASQTITLNAISDKTIGDPSFPVTATSSAGLSVVLSTTSDKISLSSNTVTLVKAGRASITGNQAGDDATNPAPPVTVSFCIKPTKPVITISNNFSDTPTLTSSTASNYQWYKNNVLIPGATSQTLSVAGIGQYKVSTTEDDCANTSEVFAIVVTANEPVLPNSDLPVEVFPNPSEDFIYLRGIIGKFEYRFSSIIGSTIPIKLEKEGADYKGYVGSLPQGYYVLTVKQPTRTQSIKILKK
jgi:hypothetical protein